MALLLRVVISKEEARRVQLSEVPQTVDALIDLIKRKLQLEGDFSLQFEDPDFKNSLCDLSDMLELPDGRAVLHTKWKTGSPLQECGSPSLGSISSLDTVSMDSSQSQATLSPTNFRSLLDWPDPFPIPNFSLDLELKLRKGNESYHKTQIGIDVSRDMKIGILDKIAQTAFEIKAYPEHGEIEAIAVALVDKHPCLKEPGKGKGYEGWVVSIRNKLNNFRAKLRQAGCNEVSVNRKRKADGDTSPSTLKRAKRGEVDFVPQHPEQHDDASLEEQRLILLEASKRVRPDDSTLAEKMRVTFSLRRKEIVEDQPMVSEVQRRWPALFFKEQICEEFCRITNKDLLSTFRAAVDTLTPKLIRLYRGRKGSFGKDMCNILDKLDDETGNIARHRKEAALRGLPVFLREEPSDLFIRCIETDPEEEATKGVAVGILFVLEECVAPTTSTQVQNIALILEESIVLEDLPDLQSALAYLLGLLYALNISYPKALKYTFETLQHVFMDIGSGCSQRVRSLQKKLL